MALEAVASTGHEGRRYESFPVLVTRRLSVSLLLSLVLVTGSGHLFLHSSSLEGTQFALRMRRQDSRRHNTESKAGAMGLASCTSASQFPTPQLWLPQGLPATRGHQKLQGGLRDHVSPVQTFKTSSFCGPSSQYTWDSSKDVGRQP